MKRLIVFCLSFFVLSIAVSAQTDSTDVVMDASADVIEVIDLPIAIDAPMDSCTNSASAKTTQVSLCELSWDIAPPTKGDGGIVYYPKPSQMMSKKGKSYEVHGVVSDISGVLAGVAIYLSEGKPTMTNEYGEFSIKTKKEDEILDISYIGYHNMKVAIGSAYRDKTIHIELKTCSRRGLDNIKVAKPLIYLYPETKTEISIINHFKGELLTTYPAYNNGWTVIAEPNGKLLNLADNRNYNWLFWDGNYTFPASHYDFKEGFYVKKGDYTNFLLEKLAYIGLNDTEINDFIVYWLPILYENEESFIHFGVNDDLGNSSRLEVTPKPDTMIRLLMEYKQYNGETKLPEQKLTSTKRKKFTLVEWGGSEIGGK